MNDIVETSTAPTQAVVSNPFGVAAPAQPTAVGAAMEQRAIAEVQAQYLMAQKFQRDERTAVDRIINAFSRPSLAERATYEYSRGGSEITGPSIRAAEAIAQQWGNIDTGFSEVSRFRDERGIGVSIVRAQAVDLQNRARKYIDFHVRHWRDTKSGGYALKDERDIYELVANQAQRRVRACILALIPGDVIESAMQQAEVTLHANVDTSPEGIKKLVDAFAPYGVTKEHIELRIQRRIDTIQPGQAVVLRRIYASLRDGMSHASEWFEMSDYLPPEFDAEIDALNRKASAAQRTAAPTPAAATEAPTPTPAPSPPPVPATASAEAATESPPVAAGDAPARLTYAQIMDAFKTAATVDAIDAVASTHLETVANAAQRKELAGEYKRMRAALEAQQ